MYIILYGEKMKKLLATLFAALCLTAAQASETITVFYAWGPGDSVANYHRTIANEANKIQDKYINMLRKFQMNNRKLEMKIRKSP
jgi:hypothetical protein